MKLAIRENNQKHMLVDADTGQPLPGQVGIAVQTMGNGSRRVHVTLVIDGNDVKDEIDRAR